MQRATLADFCSRSIATCGFQKTVSKQENTELLFQGSLMGAEEVSPEQGSRDCDFDMDHVEINRNKQDKNPIQLCLSLFEACRLGHVWACAAPGTLRKSSHCGHAYQTKIMFIFSADIQG